MSKQPKLPIGIHMATNKVTFYQEQDCCSDHKGEQELKIEVHDGGGGAYVVIKTKEFALDTVSAEWLTETIKVMCAESDKYESDTDA